MAKSIIPTQKRKRGRPPNPEGRRMSVPISFPPSVVEVLDAYAKKEGVTRSEAVRRLVVLGLAKGKAR
jgi:metal-responsive CopG/Arc/MetJ family transcriptional regulator